MADKSPSNSGNGSDDELTAYVKNLASGTRKKPVNKQTSAITIHDSSLTIDSSYLYDSSMSPMTSRQIRTQQRMNEKYNDMFVKSGGIFPVKGGENEQIGTFAASVKQEREKTLSASDIYHSGTVDTRSLSSEEQQQEPSKTRAQRKQRFEVNLPKKIEEQKKIEQQKKMEAKKKIEQQKKMEEKKKIEQQKKMEEKKKIEEQKKMEEKKKIQQQKKMEEKKKIEEQKKMEEKKKIQQQKKIEQQKKMEEKKKMEEEKMKQGKILVINLYASRIIGLPKAFDEANTSKQDDVSDHSGASDDEKDVGHANVLPGSGNSKAQPKNKEACSESSSSNYSWMIPDMSPDHPEHPKNIVKKKFVLNRPIELSRTEDGELVVRNMTSREVEAHMKNGKDPWKTANDLMQSAVVLVNDIYDRERYWQTTTWAEDQYNYKNLNGRLLIVPEDSFDISPTFIENHYSEDKGDYSKQIDKVTFLFVGSAIIQWGEDLIVFDSQYFKLFESMTEFPYHDQTFNNALKNLYSKDKKVLDKFYE